MPTTPPFTRKSPLPTKGSNPATRKTPAPDRKSPSVALRRSPTPTAIRGERFDAQTLRSEAERSARGAARHVVARKDGRKLKRMTLYLPADLAKRLAIHCAERDVDMSAVVTEAVRRHLD